MLIHCFKLLLISFFALYCWCEFALASSFNKKLEFEWDSIEGAIEYEVKLEEKVGTSWKKVLQVKSKKPIFNRDIKPGSYRFSVRTFDDRSVPGPWSDSSDFRLKWDQPELKVENSVNGAISVSGLKSGSVKLRWTQFTGVSGYVLSVYDAKSGRKIKKINTSKNILSIKLPTGSFYKFEVSAKDMAGELGESGKTTGQYLVLGTKLSSPVAKATKDVYPNGFNFITDNDAKWSVINLSYKGIFEDEFKVIGENEKTSSTAINLPKFPGLFEVRVKSYSSFRMPSDESVFLIERGDENLNLTYRELMALAAAKGSSRLATWLEARSSFFHYLNYSSTTHLETEFDSQTAGARFGLYYKIGKTYGAELVGSVDGIEYEDGDVSEFKVFTIYGVYGKNVNLTTDYKFGVGLRFAELPLIFAYPLDNVDVQKEMINFTGLAFRGEYSYHIYKNYSGRAEGYLWIPFSDPKNEVFEEVSNSGVFLQNKVFYSLDPNLFALFGTGLQFETTKYTEYIDGFSVFESDGSFAEVSQFHLSAGLQYNF